MTKNKQNKNSLAIFENFKIRRYYDEEKGIWYFSVVDIVAALTNSSIPKRYWSDLKNKLKMRAVRCTKKSYN